MMFPPREEYALLARREGLPLVGFQRGCKKWFHFFQDSLVKILSPEAVFMDQWYFIFVCWFIYPYLVFTKAHPASWHSKTLGISEEISPGTLTR